MTVVLLIGALFGGISTSNFSVSPFVQALAVGFVPTLIKNILEEFAWRGYLTPKVNSLGMNAIVGHLIVGFIWGTWHLPYYLGLLDSATIASYTSQSLVTFLPLVILGTTGASIIFGEIRLSTGSVWPAVIMHTISNIVITTLLVQGFVKTSTGTEFLFTPGMEGILSIVLITLAGLWLYRQRIQRADV